MFVHLRQITGVVFNLVLCLMLCLERTGRLKHNFDGAAQGAPSASGSTQLRGLRSALNRLREQHSGHPRERQPLSQFITHPGGIFPAINGLPPEIKSMTQ